MANDSQSCPLRVLVSAGEASGEMYGAELLEELRKLHPVESFGLGGEMMRQAGCDLVVEANDVAVVGLAEVVSHLPHIYREFHRLVDEAKRRRPDVAVLIDFPDWNLRLAKELHRLGVPVVYYVSPQLWAWRRGRIKLVERYVQKMLVIFPFEQEFYSRHGVAAEFVGHPLGRMAPPQVDRAAMASQYRLNADKQWIALLPGSRRKELRMNLPGIVGAAERLGAQYEYLLPVASTLRREWIEEQLRLVRHDQNLRFALVDDARQALAASRAAVVASGTATVEAAVVGTPFVMVYRLSGLTYNLGRHLVKLPFYGMVNLIAGRQVVPELIQEGFTSESVASHMRDLLGDSEARRNMLEGLAEVRAKLRGGSEERTGLLAARAVLAAARPNEQKR